MATMLPFRGLGGFAHYPAPLAWPRTPTHPVHELDRPCAESQVSIAFARSPYRACPAH